MHESFTGQRRKKVAQDSLIVCHPCRIGRVTLRSGLPFNHDCNTFLRRLLITGKILKLCSSDGGQHLRTPQGIVGYGQLLADQADEDGEDGGG
jgi:hypothetical protein